MAKTSRWGGLRIEPYDANAIDADGDGIVQEGTAFERPVGTRILDELGRELVGGHTSNAFMPGIQYVDQGGKPVDFLPSGRIPAPEGPKDRAKATGLSRIGHSTLKERGSLSILDIQKAAFARTAAPSPPAAPVVNQKD